MATFTLMKRAILPLVFAISVFVPSLLSGQPQVFALQDFELQGPVKSCTVITDYGEERFEFDRKGRLTKALTRFSDTDYEITHYRYAGEELAERRDEVYRDGQFDKSVSFARIYQRDTLSGTEVVEKITSYDQAIREQLTYQFDTIGRLVHMMRIHAEGIDDTEVSYSDYQGEETASYRLNDQLSKSIRKSQKETESGTVSMTLVKDFVQEVPQKAVERTSDSGGRLLSETRFDWDGEKGAFRKEETREYTYNQDGFPASETITHYRTEGAVNKAYRTEKKEFIYQRDGRTPGNWIKKITTPENSFSTRRITYYQPEPAVSTDSLPKN